MRILLALSLFLYLNFSGFTHTSGLEDITLSQSCDEIKDDSGIPYQSPTYESLETIEMNEDSDFNETLITHTCVTTKIKFRVKFIIPIVKPNLNFPNLITFGTDNSPPIS